MDVRGTKETREFYDDVGWHETDEGVSVDTDLFGVKEDGPLRVEMHNRMWARIFQHLSGSEAQQSVLEVGCGGTPCQEMLKHYRDYTGSDFSSTGLAMAANSAREFNENASFKEADAVDLPFEDNSFDTVYSAHMIYHIEDRPSQHAALREMVRVAKTGGCIVLVTANPRPILFPARLLIRLIADTPALRGIARRLKGKSPLPYNPARLSYYRKVFDDCAQVEIMNAGIASTAFNQSVSENAQPGKSIWKLFAFLDRQFPRASAYLGNYAVILVRK